MWGFIQRFPKETSFLSDETAFLSGETAFLSEETAFPSNETPFPSNEMSFPSNEKRRSSPVSAAGREECGVLRQQRAPRLFALGPLSSVECAG